MNHNYKTQQELRDAQAAGKRFKFNGCSDSLWNFTSLPSDYELVEESPEPTIKKHKHADVIIAWANGKDIEVRQHGNLHWTYTSTPQWNGDSEYRVKLKEKVKYYVARSTCLINSNKQDANVKMTFCGSTGDLLSVEKIK